MFSRYLRLQRRLIAPVVGGTVAAFVALAAPASEAQELAGPTKPKGITVEDLGKFDLGLELPGMDGRDVRARLWTMQPGGIVPVHSHAGRPSQTYVLAGQVTEHRSDTADPHNYTKGAISLEAAGVLHWWENTGSETVFLLVVDIFNTNT